MEYSIGDVIESYLDLFEEELNSGIPAKVISYEHLRQMAVVKPLIKKVYNDGVSMEYPLIEEVPVILPSAGGGVLSFPLTAGDIVYLSSSKLSLDEFKSSDGVSPVTPSSMRLNDLNDCVAHIGMTTVNRALERTEGAVELSFMGSKVTLLPSGEIEIGDSTGALVRWTQSGIEATKGSSTLSILDSSIVLDSPQVLINGINFNTHLHGGVLSGGATSGPPQ